MAKEKNQDILEKLLKASTLQLSTIMADSCIFNEKSFIETQLPILNIAFSGDIYGGFNTGLTILARRK